jgi:hypothetical protein
MVFHHEINKITTLAIGLENFPENPCKGTPRQLSKILGNRVEKAGIGSLKSIVSLAKLKARYSISAMEMNFMRGLFVT